MSDVIEVVGLRKEYRRLRARGSGGPRGLARTVAVDGLDFSVPAGGVFGFLGPNGSGKTTTIRCLLGLITPTRGTVRLFGVDPAHQLHTVMGRVGSVVENAAFFPGFSGARNLELLAQTQGIGPARVTAMLEQVGLAERGRDLVKNYSLGMRQRLGLAAALLRDPELLILDEPANGLDPAGLKDFRDLIRRLGDEGRTIFLSSHLLGEVQQVCDRVAILSQGRCIAAGPVADVLARSGATGLRVRLDDTEEGLRVLRAAGLDARLDGGTIRVALAPEQASTVTRILAESHLYLSELRPDEVSLESVFLELTGVAA